LTVTSGSHAITSPVVLQNSGNVSVAAGGLLSLSEIGASAVSLNKTGSGSMVVTGPVQYSGNTTVTAGELHVQQLNPTTTTTANATVAAGAKLVSNNLRAQILTVDGAAEVRANGGAAGASKVETLSIGIGGNLNLKNNDLVVGTGAVSSVRSQIIAGLGGITGITSDVATPGVHGFGYAAGSDASLSPSLGSQLSGQTFDADSVLVKFTYRGDADLDGDSDLDDLGFWANSFTGDLGNPGIPATFWTQGDWDYDGDTDLDDLGFWSSTFTGDLGGGGLSVYAPNAPAAAIAALGQMGISAVPEPSSFLLIAFGLFGMKILRRRQIAVVS
jgi:autotransporter-associated beta strand protein